MNISYDLQTVSTSGVLADFTNGLLLSFTQETWPTTILKELRQDGMNLETQVDPSVRMRGW